MTTLPESDQQMLDVRVLIVEDEAIIAHDVASMLEGVGYSISGIASSAPAALALAGKDPADIVLMDIRIQGAMDGIDLAAELKRIYRLPVVYMTAHTDDVTLARARETDPFGYITKPMTSAGIKVALSIALRRHRLQWQAEERESSLQTAIEQLEQVRHDLSRPKDTLALLTSALAANMNEPVHRPDRLLDYLNASSLERKDAQPVYAGDPLRLALANLKPSIDASHARIESADLPPVLVHPAALLLIFQNLLANAIQFAGDHAPLVFISAEREDSFWRFTLKDNGIGFDSDQSPFMGGLGLAISQKLVREHGGRIWADSKPGEGAEFHFTIPAWSTALAVSGN